MRKPEEVVILLVEDDPSHACLIEKNLRRSNITNEIVKLADGQQALDYLLCDREAGGRFASPQVLVLLDLNMPGISGYQVLERLKAHQRTRRVPVMVLTTTDDSVEIKKCCELGCNAYITKPVDYQQFSEAIRRLGLFLTIVRMPEEDLAGSG
jgi:CheY-like chemotaxis protein